MSEAVSLLLWLAAGWLAWPLVEYGIHGVLAHGLRTPVSPLHWAHHADPHRVFTSPLAWLPAAGLGLALLWSAVGAERAIAAVAGLLAGFLRYEYVHWRIHFREPRGARQRLLRCHHLAHHYRNPQAYYGVSTRFWDRVFRTLPDTHARDYAAVAARAPLEGPSNLGQLLPPA